MNESAGRNEDCGPASIPMPDLDIDWTWYTQLQDQMLRAIATAFSLEVEYQPQWSFDLRLGAPL